MCEVPSVRQVMYTHAAITCVDLRPRVKFLEESESIEIFLVQVKLIFWHESKR